MVSHAGFPRLIATFTFLVLVQAFRDKRGPRMLSKDKNVQVPPSFRLEVLRAFPHEGLPFTQGLEVHSDGKHLVESSGSYPPGTESYVRLVDPSSGRTVSKFTDGLTGKFVEGIVQTRNGNWFASTYQDKAAVEYSPELKMIKEHQYPGTGWGLTRHIDGESFLATNGSEHLMTLHKGSFQVGDAKVVTCMGKHVTGLNELEMVDDFAGNGPTILGNVYLSRLVLAVNPATGECTGVFSLDGLGKAYPGEDAGYYAANGLAYNKTSQTLYVTGKNWDQMFEVRVHADPQGQAAPLLSRHLLRLPPQQA